MSKIRKGSIVWDNKTKEYTKVLTSPSKGDLPDGLSLMTGRLRDKKIFSNHVLVANNSNIFMVRPMTYNNKPCRIRRIEELIPRKEYLELKKELLIKSN
jgi:hypothetical protein